MRIITFLLALTLCALPAVAEVHHSSALGWSAGEDVSEAFASALENGELAAGDELVLEHMYKITGTYALPENFTLSAVKGAGFEVTDTGEKDNHEFLILDHKNTLRNLTIRYPNTPTPKRSTKRIKTVQPRKGIYAEGKDDLRFENCHFTGHIGQHVRLKGGNNAQFIGCHIVGGYWTVFLVDEVTNPVFRNCVIEKSQGDGIKTGKNPNGGGTQNPLVENCVFQDNARDGIDTTGGWKDAVVRNTVFRRVFAGLDIKTHLRTKAHLAPSIRNSGIRIENCRFIDIPNAIVLTTADRGLRHRGEHFLTAENAPEHAPHDIDINNCTFGRTGKPGHAIGHSTKIQQKMRMLLVKAAHSVHYRNARFFGDDIQLVGIFNAYKLSGGKNISKEAFEALNYNIGGTVAGPDAPEKPGETGVSFTYGPQARE